LRDLRSGIIVKNLQNEVRRYLLGQLEEEDQERLELRLLTDPSFGEEFDTIVDEVTDQYVNNEFTDEERERIEKYFLTTPERQQKLEFATELLSHADVERGERAERSRRVVERAPSLFEQFLAFWRQRSFAHMALSAAAVVIVAGLVFYVVSFRDSRYMALTLPLSNAERGASTAPASVHLAGAGLEVNLPIPEQAKDAKDFRVKLLDENRVERDLTIDSRKDQTITVKIPAALLRRGSYVIKLLKVKTDGTEEPVRGSYFFNIE
jgi:hypothetical protein